MKKGSAGIILVTIIFVLLGLFIANKLNLALPLTIVSTSRTSELSVVGEGKVDVTPDTAYVDVGVTVENVSTVDTAQKTITEKNNAIVEALKKLNIKEENIKTSNFSIYPNTVYNNGKTSIAGYNGNVTLSVKANSPSETAQIITEATKAGANQIQGTRFVVDKPENFREKARELAINNAKDQAQKLANSLGIKLGRIVNVIESTPQSPNPPILYAEKSMGIGGAGSSADLQPGSQTISSTVTLYFEKQ